MGATSSKNTAFNISREETRHITTMWALVRPDLGRHGISFFLLFLDLNPEYMKYFKVREANKETLHSQVVLKLHGVRVIKELDFCVQNIDKEEILLQVLRQNALRHRKRSIAKEAYDHLRVAILRTFQQHLGIKFTFDMNMALDKMLHFFFQTITEINDENRCICYQKAGTSTSASSIATTVSKEGTSPNQNFYQGDLRLSQIISSKFDQIISKMDKMVVSFSTQQKYVFNGNVPIYNTTLGRPFEAKTRDFQGSYRERLATEWCPNRASRPDPPLMLQPSEIHHKHVGHLPNYTGYIPGAKFRHGRTFGSDTKDAKRWIRGDFNF